MKTRGRKTAKKAGKKTARTARGQHGAVASISPENTVENTAQTPATRPGRNGGQLQTGNPGNAGGPGRPPSVVRELALELGYNRLPRLDSIAGGENIRARVGDKAKHLPASVREQRAAIVDLLRLGGMATKIELDSPTGGLLMGVLIGEQAAKELKVTPVPEVEQ